MLYMFRTGVAFLVERGISALSSAHSGLSEMEIITSLRLSYRDAVRKCAHGISDICGLIYKMRSGSESDAISAPHETVLRYKCALLTCLAAAGLQMQWHSANVTEHRGGLSKSPAPR